MMSRPAPDHQEPTDVQPSQDAPSRSRSRRALLVPAALVGGVIAATVVVFGPGAGADTPSAPASPPTTASNCTEAASGGTTPGTTPCQSGNGTTTTTLVGSVNSGQGQGIAGPTGGQSTPSGATGPVPASSAAARSTQYPANEVAAGRSMFLQACSSCHGQQAEGTVRAPTLTGLGAAAVDFWVSTGRMPLEIPTAQAVRKPPEFSATQSREIAEYVASLAPGGPGIPNVNLSGTDLGAGGQAYRLDCATCHSFTSEGGALSYGAYAPNLHEDSPQQIAEAVRTGPGNMPRFSTANLSNAQLADIIQYVLYNRRPNDHGGLGLGHIGPVTEGFIAFVFGVGLMMLAAYWIGDRA